MRLRTRGGAAGSSGDAALGHGGDDVELLDGLEPDMTDAGDDQGLLTSGRSIVVFGVSNTSCPSSSLLSWLLLRARGELQGAIDMTRTSLHGPSSPVHRQWAPLNKTVRPNGSSASHEIFQIHEQHIQISNTR